MPMSWSAYMRKQDRRITDIFTRLSVVHSLGSKINLLGNEQLVKLINFIKMQLLSVGVVGPGPGDVLGLGVGDGHGVDLAKLLGLVFRLGVALGRRDCDSPMKRLYQ